MANGLEVALTSPMPADLSTLSSRSAQVGAMNANAAYTRALTQEAVNKQATDAATAADAALIQQLGQKHSTWQPAQSNVVQAQQAQPQQQAQPAQQTGPQQQGLGSLGSMLPQDANSYRAQSAPAQAPQQPLPTAATNAYAPLSPTNGPAILDHPELQKVTGAHNLQDTSMAIGDSPTFNAQQSYAAKGPNGQAGTFSLDRAGILQDLVSQGRGDLANGLVKQWTDADMQSEQTKQKQLVLQHATLAGHIAAFESLPESMKPQAYAGLIQQAQQEGINTSGFLPATYDPADKTGMAQLKSFEAQALTVADREKAKLDDTNAALARQKQADTAKYQTGELFNKAQENRISEQKVQLEARKADQSAQSGQAGSIDPSVVHAYVMGQLPALTGRAASSPYGVALNSAILQEDPQWSTQRAQIRHAFTTGSDGKNIGNLNTMALHTDDYIEAAKAQANGSFTPGNAIYNKYAQMFGGSKPVTLQTIGNALAGEAASALKGNATDQEISHIQQTLQGSASIPQAVAAGTALLNVGRQKLGTYQERYNQQIPGDSSYSPVLPSAAAVFGKYGLGGNNAGPSGAQHPAAAQMKDGTISQSGKYVWHGGWVAR